MLSGKGGDNHDKMIMEPMFPRLHVKDAAANIGGPRAPPRNKMALYEQLTIPLPRSNSSSVVAAGKKKAVAVAMSSDARCGHERQVFSPFYMPQPQALAHSLVNSNSQSSDGMNYNVTRSEFQRGSINHKIDGSLVDTRPIAESSSLYHNECNTRDPCGRKLYNDNLRVPFFDRLGTVVPSKKEVIVSGSPKPIPVSNSLRKRQFGGLNFSIQNLKSREKPSEINSSNFKSRNGNKSFGEKDQDARITREVTERSSSDKAADKSTAILVPLDKDVITNTRNSLQRDSAACRDCYGDDDTRLNSRSCEALTIASEHCTKQSLCSKESPTNGYGSLNLDNKYMQDRGTNQSSDLGQKNEALVTAMTESVSGMAMTPDHIAGIIGSRHFVKARLAIANQQRVFAMQVFELHRLIKVQKLIAASPHLLLEGNLHDKSSQEVPTKIAEFDPGNSSHEVAMVQKEDQDMKIVTENFNIVTPLSACESRGNRDLEVQVKHGPSANLLQVSTALDNKPIARCFHPPANRWFAPVMSPSEGFVYKPYAAPCPPVGGFMAPVAPAYGNCTPHSATMVAGDFVNQAYGVPASDRLSNMGVLPVGAAIVPNFYSAPFRLPSMNPIVPSSVVVEQVTYLAHPRPKGQMDQHSRSSCSKSNARSKAYSPYLGKFQASKDSELQGSTASCPSGKAQSTNNHAHVIKAVPHNARSALESATRIFRSIQEERQQLDP